VEERADYDGIVNAPEVEVAIRKALTQGFRPAINLLEKKVEELSLLIPQFRRTAAWKAAQLVKGSGGASIKPAAGAAKPPTNPARQG
jgi:hypothetical protein